MAHTRRIVVGAMLVLLSAGAGLAQSTSEVDKADALAEAARKGDAAAVKKLLDEGVDVNTKFRYGATVLSYACDRGHFDVVKLLLDRGADVNITDSFYGATPLTWAVSPAMGRKPQHPDVVRLLLQHGAQGKDEALLNAISEPDAATTKVILDLGGLSPGTLSDALESATIGKHQDIVAMLEQAGAKPRVEFTMEPAQLSTACWLPTMCGPARRVYQARVGNGGSFSASPVAADGKLYVASEDGDIFVVKAGPSFELLATNAMGQVIMATPAISNGVVIVRGLKDVFAIGQR